MGFRYIIYRLYLYFIIKVKFYKRKFPANPAVEYFISLEKWQSSNVNLVFSGEYTFSSIDNERVNKILEGYCLYFSKQWFFIGKNYDWVTNPLNGHRYNKNQHWTEIQDFSEQNGDIKYVWEPSRFTFIYDIVRYDIYHKTDHSKWIFEKIESWIDANPINCGPNYKCSQEISLRVLNWFFCLEYYSKSSYLTDILFQKIINAIYWQMKHVFDNINFSRIAVRNNHAITETLALYIIGLKCPFFKNALVWKSKGKRWFEEEIKYQIYSDGTYLQFSHNYHRVVVQLLCLAFNVAQKNNEFFNSFVYKRAYASLDFLYQCQDLESGWLSNYGSNDGALFFPLTECDFRDFRPQLQTLHKFLTGKPLYIKGPWDEDSFFFNANFHAPIYFEPLVINFGWKSYPCGGFYILREKDILTIITCTTYKNRPAQADNLHIDIWYKGKNVLYDGGSYQYNTEVTILKYFSGTSSHNTVMLGSNDQMLKGKRFIWYYWTKSERVIVGETDKAFVFEGTIQAFQFIDRKIKHKRIVKKSKGGSNWQIIDTVYNKPKHLEIRQLWHIMPPLEIKSSKLNSGLTKPVTKMGYVSNYYGVKDDMLYFEFETNESAIETELIIQ